MWTFQDRHIEEEVDGLRDDLYCKFEEQDQRLTDRLSYLGRKSAPLYLVRGTIRRNTEELIGMKKTVLLRNF